MNRTTHIVGLRYYIREPFLGSILNCTDTAKMPLHGKPIYLMNDKGCEQDDYAVMAYDEAGNPLGHVSRTESPFYAQLLGDEITASIRGRIVGVNVNRHSLVVEIEEGLQEGLPMPLTIGHEWSLKRMNVKLPSKLTVANHALMMTERVAITQTEWSEECRQIFDRLMELTTCDLSGDTYHKRVTLARACQEKQDPGWRQAGDRLMALIDHMGGDELMTRWISEELPTLMADEKVQRLKRTYKEYTPEQLEEALQSCPNEIGREWLSGNHMLFAKRLYYAQLPQQLMVQLLVLIAMKQAASDKLHATSNAQQTTSDHPDDSQITCSPSLAPPSYSPGETAALSPPERGRERTATAPPSPHWGGLEVAGAIRHHFDAALTLMREMQPRCTQKVDWLSFYTVLLRRRWIEENLSAFCRMAGEQFGVKLDNRTLSRDLAKNGLDHTLWTESDSRILRRKRLAQEFDRRLAEYFKQRREEVLKGVRE